MRGIDDAVGDALDQATETAPLAELEGWVEILPDGRRQLRLEETLEYTEKVGGQPQTQRVDSLTFRRPRAGDLDLLENQKSGTAGIREIIAALTGVPAKKIAELDLHDFMRAIQVFADFLPPRLSRSISSAFSEI